MSEATAIIPMKEYLGLLDDARILQCLRNQGVDNWEGWDDAMDEYEEGSQ